MITQKMITKAFCVLVLLTGLCAPLSGETLAKIKKEYASKMAVVDVALFKIAIELDVVARLSGLTGDERFKVRITVADQNKNKGLAVFVIASGIQACVKARIALRELKKQAVDAAGNAEIAAFNVVVISKGALLKSELRRFAHIVGFVDHLKKALPEREAQRIYEELTSGSDAAVVDRRRK